MRGHQINQYLVKLRAVLNLTLIYNNKIKLITDLNCLLFQKDSDFFVCINETQANILRLKLN